MGSGDSFEGLARFYDPIMQHVNYDRWYLVTTAVADLLPRPFRHLDAACGTGMLLKKLWRERWNSYGLDLSSAMLQRSRETPGPARAVCADLRAIPASASFDYVTSLFDSVNFLLAEEDLYCGIGQLTGALRPQGVLYFDVVTERMVLDHFAGQSWSETNGGFTSHWTCEYDRGSGIVETRIRVNSGEQHTLRERVYPVDLVLDAAEKAGCQILASCDAQTWNRVNRRTIRVDIVAVRGSTRDYKRAFRGVSKLVREMLG
ncbi:MAG TPA: class I SAM-dependent methyltransferase [Candidatus Hydrogenedentes bacterium]|nr:class I SAM-dependent methyltransferase [Candidatus Hydrogenedentota bacterium]HRK34193.1 class I SAM-dependent methyltransferase [Candidatus Hydrogenedentota bacterium]